VTVEQIATALELDVEVCKAASQPSDSDTIQSENTEI
jgi:hypothetical protein